MRLKSPLMFLPRLAADRNGGVAMMTGLLIIPLMLIIGMMIDYARLCNYRMVLQDAVDRAALAGAAAYTDSNHAQAAIQAAENSFNNTNFPSSVQGAALTGTTASTGTYNRSGTANNVVLTASANVQMTITSLFMQSYTVQATAKASNPTVTFSSNALAHGNFGSTAGDWNAVYVYAVPLGSNGQPDFTQVPDPTTVMSNNDEIGSNCVPNTTEPCVTKPGAFVNAGGPTLAISANTVIGFAFKNVTAGRGGPYTNQYGAISGQDNWFYSSLLGAGLPPSYDTDRFELAEGHSNTHYSTAGTGAGQTNCSLQIAIVPGQTLPAVPPAGHCYAPTDPASGAVYAKLTCAQMQGHTYVFWWNDMGAARDNFNWNDIYYTISCTVSDGGAGGIVLSQ